MSNKVSSIILASTSPHRRALLDATGLCYSVAAPVDREADIVHANPRQLAQLRATAKAEDISIGQPDALVIGGDQVLGFEGKPYDKVSTKAEAFERLQKFSGHTHHLYSALTLAYGGRPIRELVVIAEMTMHPLSDQEIDAYLTTNEWRGCVGCYQFENSGGQLFSKVSGTHSTIIGLPIQELFQCLRSIGMKLLTNPKGPWTLDLS